MRMGSYAELVVTSTTLPRRSTPCTASPAASPAPAPLVGRLSSLSVAAIAFAGSADADPEQRQLSCREPAQPPLLHGPVPSGTRPSTARNPRVLSLTVPSPRCTSTTSRRRSTGSHAGTGDHRVGPAPQAGPISDVSRSSARCAAAELVAPNPRCAHCRWAEPEVLYMDARGAGAVAGAAMPRVVISAVATVDGRISLSRRERLPGRGTQRDVDESCGHRTPPTRRTPQGSGLNSAIGLRRYSKAAAPSYLTKRNRLTSRRSPTMTPRSRSVRTGSRSALRAGLSSSTGVVEWNGSFTGDEQMSLLVAVCRATPITYLAYLRRRQIPYLVAGEERVDLRELMAKCAGLLGVSCVVSEGGGGINAALVAADLVDEVHVVTSPVLVGGVGAPFHPGWSGAFRGRAR